MQEMWNERYRQEEYAYGTEVNDFLKLTLPKLPNGKILFISEGEGRNAVYAAKMGWKVYAVDLSEEGKLKADKLAQKVGVSISYQVIDANDVIYPDNFFDAIVLIYAHFPENIRRKIHEKVQEWLKPGGLIILEAFNTNQLNYNSGGPKEISMLYSSQLLREDFSKLEIQSLIEELIILNEGKYHQGEAAVVRLLAAKK